MRPFEIVVAIDVNSGIGKKGGLPWHLPGDLKHFKELTTKTQNSAGQNAVIMGRRTWESLPEKFQPLPQRLNVVLTRNKDFVLPGGVLKSSHLSEALALLAKEEWRKKIEKIFVIGGAEVFQEAVKNPFCQTIHLTQIFAEFDCDVFFPEFKSKFQKAQSFPKVVENSLEYYIEIYRNNDGNASS